MGQFCWDICTVLEMRLIYLSADRIITMQALLQDVRIIIMMQQSNANVSNSLNNLHVNHYSVHSIYLLYALDVAIMQASNS